jgi:hypothetical protein
MTEREAERRRFERWLRGAEPATEAEARTKGERLRREFDRERMGRLMKGASRPQFWWQRGAPLADRSLRAARGAAQPCTLAGVDVQAGQPM